MSKERKTDQSIIGRESPKSSHVDEKCRAGLSQAIDTLERWISDPYSQPTKWTPCLPTNATAQ